MPTEKKSLESLRVAVIHDWLITYRGGEKVLEAILELFPQAEIFTLFHRSGKLPPQIEQHTIHTSPLSRLPFIEKYYRYLLPLFPRAIEQFDLSRFDLVVSSSHCVAKGVLTPRKAVHVCYCHTPMRYIWDRYDDYFAQSKLEPLIRKIAAALRHWDVLSASRVDGFIANSSWVKQRIENYYKREAVVIHPFADLDFFKPLGIAREDFYLVVSAFAPYKRIDLAIEACKKLGRKLVIAGAGQDAAKLKEAASPLIQFVDYPSPKDLRDMYARARALLFPGEEDFGIVPVEAMAVGLPVIAFGKGGVLDTVVEGATGLFFGKQTAQDLIQAIVRFEKGKALSERDCVLQASQFTKSKFQSALKTEIERMLALKH